MKMKIKKAIACILLGMLFAGVFMVGLSISWGVLTRLQGLLILGGSGALTIAYLLRIKEGK